MPIDLIDTIKPKNNGTFPMVEAEDVVVGKGTADEKRLPEALAEAGKVAEVDTTMPASPSDNHVPSTQLLKELLSGYLKLTGGTLQKGATITIPYSGNSKIDGLRLRLIRGIREYDATINSTLFLNFQSTTVPTEDYLKDNAETGKYAVFIAGWGEKALVLRKGDCDYLYAPKTHAHSDYLPLSGGTLSGNLKFSNKSSELWVSNLKSAVGTLIYDVTPGKGTNFLSIYQLTGYTVSGERGKVFFTQENATTNWIDVTTLKEGGTPIADKYAVKAEVYTKAEVDEKITSALGDINAALAQI